MCSRVVSKAVLAVLCAAAAVCVAPAAAAVGASGWAAKADATCRSWNDKVIAALGGHPTIPTTRAGMYGLMVKMRPLELGRLHALAAIVSPPPGAAKAFALVRSDIAELDASVAAYRAGNTAGFGRDATVWFDDQRASRAFAALGAKSCA
jgi:hypothetical protein